MRHTTRMVTVLAILCGQAAIFGSQAGQPTTGPQRDDNRLTTLNGFTVDYPKKDWQLLVGTGSSLVVFTHKTRDATVAIERRKLEHPFAPSDITEQTAKLEIEDWASRRPLASGFGHQFLDWAGARIIITDFKQLGHKGEERVRMYSIPRGTDWYRVVCTSTLDSFDKYKDACHRIALSLTTTTSP